MADSGNEVSGCSQGIKGQLEIERQPGGAVRVVVAEEFPGGGLGTVNQTPGITGETDLEEKVDLFRQGDIQPGTEAEVLEASGPGVPVVMGPPAEVVANVNEKIGKGERERGMEPEEGVDIERRS